MKIVLLESLSVSNDFLQTFVEKLESKGHTFEVYEKTLDESKQISYAKDADVVMIANMPLSGKVIDACQNLKFIDVAFTGVDHIDLEKAKEKNVAVSNASGYSNTSVAELVLGYSLNLLRNVNQVEKRCREGGTKDGLVGFELKGKTAGIVGYGAIGRETSKLFNAFGCKVIAYDAFPKDDTDGIAEYKSLNEVLSESDIVTLHSPLIPETINMINKETLKLMKPSAYLINAARGPIVNSQDLADALNNDKLAGAAVDVFEIEPPLDLKHPLLNSKNTIVTPHIAFASAESMKRRVEIVFNSLDSWLDGKQINKII